MSSNPYRQIALAMLTEDAGPNGAGHWDDLVSGHFTVLDQFDQNGCRYVIATRANGQPSLTARERRVLAARARGFALKLIAVEFRISIATVSRVLESGMR
jgi:hypothetical protein